MVKIAIWVLCFLTQGHGWSIEVQCYRSCLL